MDDLICLRPEVEAAARTASVDLVKTMTNRLPEIPGWEMALACLAAGAITMQAATAGLPPHRRRAVAMQILATMFDVNPAFEGLTAQ